jgi:hypothetical protein
MTSLSAAGAFVPVDQHYLLQARQMQALSFTVHIPLVAFGISVPGDGAVRRVAPARNAWSRLKACPPTGSRNLTSEGL